MKELLKYMIEGLVNHPDEIVIDEQVLPDGLIILSISANPEDYGRIIGRQGMLIRSLRTIIKARAIKEQKKVMVRVMTEDHDDQRETEVEKKVDAVMDKKAEESTETVVAEDALDDNLV